MSNQYIRPVTEEDSRLLYEWRNEELVRKNFFNQEIIPWENHEQWFKKILASDNEYAFILVDGNDLIGQVRLTVENDVAEISYSIDKKFRCLGYGGIILQLIENMVAETMLNIKLCAQVKGDNIASQYLFEKLGYTKSIIKYEKIAEKSTVNAPKFAGGVLLLSNNRNSLCLYDWLSTVEENVYFYSDKIDINLLENLKPKLIISYNYKHIVPKNIIDYVGGNIINLHTSYLPWNKGSSPNIWSFIDDTPKGITIHKLVEKLDAGNIIAQKIIEFDENIDTLESSYNKLNTEIVNLLKDIYDDIISKNYIEIPQIGQGSYHTTKDLKDYMQGNDIDYSMTIKNFRQIYGKV